MSNDCNIDRSPEVPAGFKLLMLKLTQAITDESGITLTNHETVLIAIVIMDLKDAVARAYRMVGVLESALKPDDV